MAKKQELEKKIKRQRIHIKRIIVLEVLIVIALFATYSIIMNRAKQKDENNQVDKDNTPGNISSNEEDEDDNPEEEALTQEQLEAQKEQEKLKQEEQERQALIDQAKVLAAGYSYDEAIALIQTYEGSSGGFGVYTTLVAAIEGFEATKQSLVLYGGSYTSVTQFNHIFFHSLIADNSKAFDGDYQAKGYNMYMTTVLEFKNMMQKMYEDGYVLVTMHDLAQQETLDDGTTKFVESKIYLPEGKKPFVLSQDDVNYYEYMDGDGFASRIVLGEDGKPTCEMILEDGSITTGDFDMVPIIDAFVEEHPDFSYQGAKGLIALTGYEGTLGYRTNDPTSPTYEQDKEMVKKVAEAMKAEGWEFASHSWGHKNMLISSDALLERDTKRWLEEVEPLIGSTDIYVYPYGVDIETTMGLYSSDKYKFLKESGFNYFCGVFKDPWMHVKDDYVRMTRRPLDGQALIQFSDRLADLFDSKDIIDPERPSKNW